MNWLNERLQSVAKLVLLIGGCGLVSCAQPCTCTCGCAQPAAAQPATYEAAQKTPQLALFSQRSSTSQPPPERRVVISVEQQMLMTYENGMPKKRYPVSTSRFGVGDKMHSWLTPLGHLEVVDIIGEGLPKGALLRGRQPTGEIVKVNTPGHDAIVTRIVRLRGKEPQNARALQRCIYIHGTTAERCLKRPMSWGCVRMSSRDIIRLCHWVTSGTRVDIIAGKLPTKHMPLP